ncbi:MAG: 2-C-methyl-D-erythritol 2,4-cyclodiphosphate synthase [Holosporales bacterium]|nr:2-C-methyl-D-erythritol 2,4-cyclodiphosphate synthase [Holosporales bacterium]
MSGIYVIIAAGGCGLRCPGSLPKQFRKIDGESVIKRAIRPFIENPSVSGILSVIPDGYRDVYEEIVSVIDDPRLLSPIYGGATRFESVKNGLEQLVGYSPEYVLIHDAARDYCPSSVIDRVIDAVRMPGIQAVIPVVRSVDSVRISGKSVDRSLVGLVQTPQAFDFNIINGLYERFEDSSEFSDDSSLCDAAGIPVTTVDGHRLNKKITFPEDFEIPRFRTGFGFDAHRFSGDPNRGLYLMGTYIDGFPGLEGHSDADVGIHSLVDAILGALGAGDIGMHFPPESPRWKSADSKVFLRYGRDLLMQHNSSITHIDVTIVCESPRVADYSKNMKMEVSGCLEIREEIINIKGKTTEGMGFTGRREGIAVYSIVTIAS